MTDFSSESLKHDRIIELVQLFSKNADSEGNCNGFTTMWFQAVLMGKEQERVFYARLNRFSMLLPTSHIHVVKEKEKDIPSLEEVSNAPDRLVGKIYLSGDGSYVVYTYDPNGKSLVRHEGSLFDNIASDVDKEELKKNLSTLDENFNRNYSHPSDKFTSKSHLNSN